MNLVALYKLISLYMGIESKPERRKSRRGLVAKSLAGALVATSPAVGTAEAQGNSFPSYEESVCRESEPLLPVEELITLARGGFGRVQMLGAQQPINQLHLLGENELEAIQEKLRGCSSTSRLVEDSYREVLAYIALIRDARRGRNGTREDLDNLFNGTASNVNRGAGGSIYSNIYTSMGIDIPAINQACSRLESIIERRYREALSRGESAERAAEIAFNFANRELQRLGLINTERRLAANF